MNKTLKFSVVTVIVAVVAFSLSHIIWPDPLSALPPNDVQRPFFVLLEIIEAIAFGFGISFLLFVWKPISRAFENSWLARLAFFSADWLLLSWWPHDNMHRITQRGNYTALLKIEYGFHLTLIIAGFILAYFLWVLCEKRNVQTN